MPNPASRRRDLHTEVTDQLIAAIESGPGNFMLPWHSDAGSPLHLPINALTGKSYTGVNILSLWVAASRSNFKQPVWATYRQWTECGAQVRKGERAATVIFYKELSTNAESADVEDNGQRRVARASAVFNADQVTGFAPLPLTVPRMANGEFESVSAVDKFIADTNAIIRHSGDRAYYDRNADRVQIPTVDRFIGTTTSTVTEAFYSTILHELVHWSGATHRLNRTFGKRFGDKAYAAEELVAEIGAAFLCAELNISNVVRADHAQYLTSWLQLLKQDERAIFVAAARATEAVRFIGTAAKQARPRRPNASTGMYSLDYPSA